MEETPQVQVERRQNRGFILGSLCFGHGVAHLYDVGLPALLPTIASAFGLSNFQVASLHGIRQAGFGAVNIGGGPFVDILKRQWGLILTGCMIWAAISFILIGASPNFPVLVIAMIAISIPGSLWHLPATAALSQRFPDRRGFAISMHGFGANIGSSLGPQISQALLRILPWRILFFIYAAPALVLAGFVWWSLKDLGRERGQEERRERRSWLEAASVMVKNPVVLGLLLAATIRGIGLGALFNWTPFYLEEELGMGHIRTGFYLSLFTGMGIVSAPLLGALSDKLGRKPVLVPGFILATVLSLLVVSAGDGYLLALVFVGMGFFNFALHQILQAAVLDIVGRGTEATTIGLLFGINGIIGVGTPFLVALMINHLGGYGTIFYYAGILTAVTTVIVIFLPLRAPRTPEPVGS